MQFIKHTGRLLSALGALLIIGTAGASDHGTVPMDRIILQCAVGFGLIALGALLNKLSNFIFYKSLIEDSKEHNLKH